MLDLLILSLLLIMVWSFAGLMIYLSFGNGREPVWYIVSRMRFIGIIFCGPVFWCMYIAVKYRKSLQKFFYKPYPSIE